MGGLSSKLNLAIMHRVLFGALTLAALCISSAGFAENCVEQSTRRLLHLYDQLPTITLAVPRFRHQINFPPEIQKRLGIRRLFKAEKLGSGGYGTVYLVHAEMVDGSGRKLAWKELKEPSPRKKLEQQSPLQLESDGARLQYRAVKSLASQDSSTKSHLIPIHCRVIFKDNHNSTISEAYLMDLAGPTMHTLAARNGALSLWDSSGKLKTMDDGPYPPQTVVRLVAKALQGASAGLAELASAGLTYRDVKLENMAIFGGKQNTPEEVLTGEAHFGFLDPGTIAPHTWGLVDPRTGIRWITGTELYFSPEVLNAREIENTYAVDAYALAFAAAKIFGAAPKTNEGVHLGFAFVSGRLERIRKALESAGLGPTDLQLFDDIVLFIQWGLEEDPRQRIRLLKGPLPSPIFRFADDGRALGPDPDWLSRSVLEVRDPNAPPPHKQPMHSGRTRSQNIPRLTKPEPFEIPFF